MWQGGFSVGPRYLVPMLPFMAFAIIFWLNAIRATWLQIATWLLAVLSFLIVWAETIGGQTYPAFQADPLVQYSLPRLTVGDIARNVGMVLRLGGWASLLPLLLAAALLIALLVRRDKTIGRHATFLSLAQTPPVAKGEG